MKKENRTFDVDMVIEIPRGSSFKYEYDAGCDALRFDRFLPFQMPCNYGYVPNRLAPDGDFLDVVLLSRHSFTPGCRVRVRVVGLLAMRDEKGKDDKLVVVIGDEFGGVGSIEELRSDVVHRQLVDEVDYFFRHYKDGEEGKWVEVDGYRGVEEARRAYDEAVVSEGV